MNATTNSYTTTASGCGGLPTLLLIYFIVCWVINLFKFLGCDFASPYEEEVIHGIGVFSFFGSGITAWL